MELDLYDQYQFKALNQAMFAEKGRVNVTGNGFAIDNDLEFSVLIAGLYNALGD